MVHSCCLQAMALIVLVTSPLHDHTNANDHSYYVALAALPFGCRICAAGHR